jgi:hypothetical protein
MGEAMDKLAAHHMALAFLEELESLQGYPLDNMTKEAMYKEAINLAEVMGQGRKLVATGTQMLKNPSQAVSKLQETALKAQMSPMGQMMATNPAAATTLLGGQIAGGIGGMLGGKASGSALNAAAGAVSNPIAKQGLGMAGSLTNMFT